jgi:hypothetical protein
MTVALRQGFVFLGLMCNGLVAQGRSHIPKLAFSGKLNG